MNKADHLIEFEKSPYKRKLFKIVPFLVIFILSTYLVLLFPLFKNILLQKQRIIFPRSYFHSLLIIYPVVGLYGYFKIKKYGWFIISHYTISSFFITSIIVFKMEYYNDGKEFQYLYLMLIFSSVCSLIGSIFLFRKEFCDLFDLKRKDIMLFALLFILFDVLHAIILSQY